MKKIKFCIIIIIVSVIAIVCAIDVYADNITSVLRKYNVGVQQVNTETLEAELAKAVSEYTKIETEYREKQALIHTVDLTTMIMRDTMQANDINAASMDMRRKEDYLTALINVDADLEKIFEAEKEYREAQRQLGIVLDMSGILATRIESLGIYKDFMPETSEGDVEQAAMDLRTAKDKLSSAKNLVDIGDTSNLKYPINYPATVTSPFGIRKNPFGGVGTEFHYGLDLAAPTGSEVTSLFNGVIAKAEFDVGLGNYVIVTHGKEFQTLYAHLSELKVKTGDRVKQYDVIGLVGSTGRSTGPHLHLGVYINGQKVDPMKLFI